MKNAALRLVIEQIETLSAALLHAEPHLRSDLEGDPSALDALALGLQRAVLWLSSRAMAQARGMLPPLSMNGKSIHSLVSSLQREEEQLRGNSAALGGLSVEPRALRELLASPLWKEANSEALGEVYEGLLARRPRLSSCGQRLVLEENVARARKARGSYYTRPELRESLLDGTLEPLFSRAAGPTTLSILDPTCGSGNLLVGAARRLARRGVTAAQAVERCLHGVDVDPAAVELCRLALWLEGGFVGRWPAALQQAIRCADSLTLSWTEAFPEVFASGGFDCILGNPPFVNSIEGPRCEKRERARRALPEFGGTADLAYLLLGASLRLVHPRGRLGMIQPRTLLNARPAERFRRAPPGGFRLVELRIPGSASLFPGAAVFVCQVVFAKADSPILAVHWGATQDHPERTGEGKLEDPNWWSEALRLTGRAEASSAAGPGGLLGDHFQVEASMTAGDAYDAIPFLVDTERGEEPKLVTTGLIEPRGNLWGTVPCRYLKRDYRFPRLKRDANLTRSLQRRSQQAARPKILVAGLSRVVECFLDPRGECLGAVSTYSIYHPEDDLKALSALESLLLSPQVTTRFRTLLGANALGGGNTTMTKEFLRNLPLSEEPA